MFIADVHFDSKHCDRNLLTKHLNYCKDNGIDVFILGDFFDCMGGKYDKRTNKSDILPEYQCADYFNAVTESAIEYLRKFNVVKLITMGNHESSVLQQHEIDLTKTLCTALDIQGGDYRGFITVNLRGKESNGKKFVIYYTHGEGGNSPVTKGTLLPLRRAATNVADLYLSGHLHQAWSFPTNMFYVDNNNNIKEKSIKHLQTGTYEDSLSAYADRKGHAPSSKGGWIVRFRYGRINGDQGFYYEVEQKEF
jgi:predicted phosphodiesterase